MRKGQQVNHLIKGFQAQLTEVTLTQNVTYAGPKVAQSQCWHISLHSLYPYLFREPRIT